MQKILKYTFVAFLLATVVTTAGAQKFGYINSAELLQMMPEVKEAEANLETFRTQLQNKGKAMLEEFQTNYVELQRKNQQGEISPKQLEEESLRLQEEEQKIAQYEQDMQRQLMEKRETLLSPILEEVNDAIQEVATEEGYTYIFDASPGGSVLLYADESTNVIDLVKAKLGL